MSKPLWTIPVIGLFLVVSAACADDDAADTAATLTTTTTTDAVEAEIEIPDDALDLTGQADVEVTVQDNVFIEQIIVISPGTRVTWVNEGILPHNVKPAIEGAFTPIDTGELEPEMRQARVFDDAGDYPYFCSLHGTASQGQTGRIIVQEA